MDRRFVAAIAGAVAVGAGLLVARRWRCTDGAAATDARAQAAQSHNARECTQFVPSDGDVDVLYHLGVSSNDGAAVAQFKDTKFVVMAGTQSRTKACAAALATKMGVSVPTQPVFAKTDRYVVYKVGPIVCASHGVGKPSMSVVLHELLKLMRHAKADGVTFMRIGTCGGVGVQVGSVVLSSVAVNGEMKPQITRWVLGRPQHRSTAFDSALVEQARAAIAGQLPVVVGKTLAANDFYEEQGRCDGAWRTHTRAEALEWLRHIHESGVRNIEMESSELAAFCNQANVPAVMLAVAIVDRLRGDQVTLSHEELDKCEASVIDAAWAFVSTRI